MSVGVVALDGDYLFMVRVYVLETGGTSLYIDVFFVVLVQNGVFRLVIGAVGDLDVLIFDGEVRFVGVVVGGESEFLCQLFCHVVYVIDAMVVHLLVCTGCIILEYLDPAVLIQGPEGDVGP